MHHNQEKKHPQFNPLAVISFGIFAVSTSSIFIRLAQEEASSLVIAAFRLSIASLVLAPIALSRYRDELRRFTKKEYGLGIVSGLFLAVHFGSWISSLEYTTVASSVVLVSTSPLWVALVAPFTLREIISKRIMIGMVVALIGVTIVGVSDSCFTKLLGLNCPPLKVFLSGDAFFGNILAIIGAFGGAGYLIIGRNLRAKYSLVPYIFLVYSSAAIALNVVVLMAGLQVLDFSVNFYLWILYLGLIPQLLGHSSFNWALGYLSAAFVSITLLGEPIGSTILAYFILDEVPAPIKLFGAILILVGIFIAIQQKETFKGAKESK